MVIHRALEIARAANVGVKKLIQAVTLVYEAIQTNTAMKILKENMLSTS